MHAVNLRTEFHSPVQVAQEDMALSHLFVIL